MMDDTTDIIVKVPMLYEDRIDQGYPEDKTEERYLTPGVINDDARYVFQTGWCRELARAIAAKAERPVIAVGWHTMDHGFVEKHVGVEIDSGLILDIEGVHEELDWIDAWTPANPIWPVTTSEVDDDIDRVPLYSDDRLSAIEEAYPGISPADYYAQHGKQISDDQLNEFAKTLLNSITYGEEQ